MPNEIFKGMDNAAEMINENFETQRELIGVELIASGKLNEAGMLSLTGISQDFTHLRLVINGRRNVSGAGISDTAITFNNISSNSYFTQASKVSGTNLTAEKNTSNSLLGRLGDIDYSGASVIDFTIYDYTTSAMKVIQSKNMVAGTNTATSELGEMIVLFTLNAPINHIETSFLAAGTKYWLYGIK